MAEEFRPFDADSKLLMQVESKEIMALQNARSLELMASGCPRSDIVLIHLNALAIVVAATIAGTKADPRAIDFFNLALNNQLGAFIKDGLNG